MLSIIKKTIVARCMYSGNYSPEGHAMCGLRTAHGFHRLSLCSCSFGSLSVLFLFYDIFVDTLEVRNRPHITAVGSSFSSKCRPAV